MTLTAPVGSKLKACRFVREASQRWESVRPKGCWWYTHGSAVTMRILYVTNPQCLVRAHAKQIATSLLWRICLPAASSLRSNCQQMPSDIIRWVNYRQIKRKQRAFKRLKPKTRLPTEGYDVTYTSRDGIEWRHVIRKQWRHATLIQPRRVCSRIQMPW